MPVDRSRVVIATTVHPICDVRILYREARSLARAGYDVEVIGPPPGPESDSGIEGVRLTLIPRETRRLRRALAGGWRLVRMLLGRRADVYHLHDPELLWVGLVLRLAGRRVVFDLHEDLPLQILAKAWIPRALRPAASRVAALLLRAVAGRLSGLVAATDVVAQRLPKRRGPIVVHNYPVLDLMPPMAADATRGTSTLVYVGGISRDRGALEMLQALDRLDRNDVELVLVGTASADIRLDLESWAKDPRFRVVPWEPPLRVYERLAQADIGLACLHPLPRYIDARPVKLFEYMAAGIPVIASDFAGYRRIIEEANCGLVVDPLDPDQLAEAIRFLLDSPEERMRLGRNGRKAVEERYNWRSEEEKLLELYARITARTPAR